MAYLLFTIAICGLLFVGFYVGGVEEVFETLAIFLFRLSCAFVFLYVVHIFVDGFDVFVPVNLFSAVTIAVLGIPGILCIGVLTFFH